MLTRRAALISAGATLAVGCANAQPTPPANPHYVTTHKPLPFRVQEIYPAAHKGRIHVAGGLLSNGTTVTGVSDQHIAYDPRTGASATLAKLPAHRHHPHAVSHNGRLYLVGGFGTNPNAVNWIMATDTLRYDDATNSWASLAPAPEPHAEVVATSLGASIHIVGGRRPKGAANLAYGDHEDVTRHLVYDPAANTWRKAAPALTARNSASGGVINGLWHVVGGRSVANGPTDAHEVYDPKEDRWRNAAPMPKGSGVGGNAAGVLADKLYVFGGEYFDNGGRVHPEAWQYDPATDAWTSMPPMPTPRHGLGAIVIDRSIYLVGGARKPSGSDTSDAVESFTLS